MKSWYLYIKQKKNNNKHSIQILWQWLKFSFKAFELRLESLIQWSIFIDNELGEKWIWYTKYIFTYPLKDASSKLTLLLALQLITRLCYRHTEIYKCLLRTLAMYVPVVRRLRPVYHSSDTYSFRVIFKNSIAHLINQEENGRDLLTRCHQMKESSTVGALNSSPKRRRSAL